MSVARTVIKILEANGNSEHALGMQKYMRDQFEFYGVPSPLRKTICKKSYSDSKKLNHEQLIQDIHELWDHPKREVQYVALDILIKNKNRLEADDIIDVEQWIVQHSWWDTVDGIASHIVGILFKKYPALIPEWTNRWLASDNIWLNRTCLIYQLKYKQDTDFRALQSYILKLMHKDEFFIQKAIGWSLRQYSKYNPKEVRSFVEKYSFSRLAQKEALRLIT